MISLIIWIFLLIIWVLTPYWIPYLQILSCIPFLFCWCCKLHYGKAFSFDLFIHFWLRWVFVSALRLPLVAESGGYSRCGLPASCCSGFSCCGAQALGTWASVAAPRHVGSSQSWDWTHAPCIGRQILNHWTTRRAPTKLFNLYVSGSISLCISLCSYICGDRDKITRGWCRWGKTLDLRKT